jgi:hypothetical protein
MLDRERRVFAVLLRNLAEGTTKTLSRRSRGRKAGKRERKAERKRVFVCAIRFVVEREVKKVKKRKENNSSP